MNEPFPYLTSSSCQLTTVNCAIQHGLTNCRSYLQILGAGGWLDVSSTLRTHNSGVTYGPHCYLALSARCICAYIQLHIYGGKKNFSNYAGNIRPRFGHPCCTVTAVMDAQFFRIGGIVSAPLITSAKCAVANETVTISSIRSTFPFLAATSLSNDHLVTAGLMHLWKQCHRSGWK